MDIKQKLLRIPEVAKRLGLKESTIRKMVFERRLPTVRIGRTVTIPEDFIERMIRENYRPALDPGISSQ